MDIESQPRNTWIALGTLAGLGVLLGFFKTWKWFSRSGKDIVDLPVSLDLLSLARSSAD